MFYQREKNVQPTRGEMSYIRYNIYIMYLFMYVFFRTINFEKL